VSSNIRAFAKNMYDGIRGRGNTHATAVERVVGALPMLVPEAGASELEAAAVHVRGLERTQQAPAVMQGEAPFTSWFDPARKPGWIRWQRYRRYLLENKGWAFDSVAALDESSDEIVKQLGAPGMTASVDRRGLVAGSVQSGKTASYMALICKAIDAGYRMVIVLAGIHNSLRHQTQVRIDEEIIGVGSNRGAMPRTRVGVGLLEPTAEHPSINSLTGRGEDGDFSVQVARRVAVNPGETPLLLVVKKNVVVLEHLISYLRGLSSTVQGEGGIRQLRGVPLLLIDDEADQASINFRAVRGEEDELDPSLDPSRVNEQIRKLLMTFTQRTYVGYTATPFANVLISPESEHQTLGPDLFPRDFIVALHPPDDYIGPRQVFGTGLRPDGTQDPGMPVVRAVEDHQTFIPEKHRQDHNPGELPGTLRAAVLGYLLAGAVRCCRGQATRHHTMLIHVTRFTAVQGRVSGVVDRFLRRVRSILEYGSGAAGTPESREGLLDEFRGLWRTDFEPTSAAMGIPLPAWEEVEEQLLPGLRRVTMRVINGDAGDVLDYEQRAREGAWVIAVGGDKLSRGLTLEGLAVSYYLRASKTYDTLMQMGRWFGYRPGYADLCRIHTTPDLVSWFQHIVVATEALWEEFETMQRMGSTPREFGLRVMAHPAMEVTSPMKMREAQRISLSYSGTVQETIMFDPSPALIAGNQQAVDTLVGLLGAPERPDGRGPFLWSGVPATTTLSFLRSYRTHSDAVTVIASRLAEYIELHQPSGLLTTWTVAVMSTKQPVPGNGTGTAGPHRVQRFQRTPLQASITACTRIGRMLSPDDELIDLTEAELKSLALNLPRALAAAKKLNTGKVTAQDARGYDLDGAPFRIGRPATRGLLILYPLVLGQRGADLQNSVTTWGMAISFPRSRQLQSHDFVANAVWLEQVAAG
jgi:hypothetical protein